MKLHELHVAQFGAGAIGHGQPVAGGDLGIGRFRDRPAPRRRCTRMRLLGPDERLCRARSFQTSAPRQAPSCVSRSSVKVFSQVSTLRQIRACSIDDGPHDFLAGGVAQGMHDAMMAVAAFAAQSQLAGCSIEAGAPIDQFVNALAALRARPSRRPPDRKASPPADERIGDVVFEAILGIEHAGNAPWA